MTMDEALDKLRKEYPEVMKEVDEMTSGYVKRADALDAILSVTHGCGQQSGVSSIGAAAGGRQ